MPGAEHLLTSFQRLHQHGASAGEVCFQGQDLLHAPEAELTARVRGKAITFIPHDPQASLNPLFPVGVQAQILLLLKMLVKERRTSVLLITHDLGVVAKLCDRVVGMYAGQGAEVTPTASLFAHPSHPYTQQLLDSLPERQHGTIRGIPGAVPHLVAPPPGCRFHTRCALAMPACSQERPAAVEVFPDHWVRCHLFPGAGNHGNHT